jgi:hypothetical protein
MRNNFFLLSSIASFFLLTFCFSPEKKDPLTLYDEIDNSAPVNTLSSAEKNKGWKLLFDGKTAEGWHGYNMQGMPDSWFIEDNSLTMIPANMEESQGIVTDKIYKNFALYVDFKLTKSANSGILYQVFEDPKYTFPYETGPEFQIIDHENWPDPLEDWQICGACYAMYPPKSKPYKELGEWNQAFIVVNGNFVTYILNGEIVVEYEKYSDDWNQRKNSGKWADYPDFGKFDEGHIALQNHGTKVWFRNIKIKEIK